MAKLRAFLIATVLVSSIAYPVAHAEREDPPKPDRSMSMFKEGTQLFNNEISPFRDRLMRQCVGDASQKWLEQLAGFDTKIAALAKPDDKRQLVEYMAVLRPWVEAKVKSIPDVGTWADAKAAVKAMVELATVAPPPVGSSDAEMTAMIGYAVKVRSMDKARKAISYTQNKVFACEEYFGKTADLHGASQTLNNNMIKLEAALTEAAREVARTRLAPFRNAVLTLSESKQATTWGEQVGYVRAAFDVLGTARDIVANEARYAALGDYDVDPNGPAWAIPEAKKQIAALSPTIVARLGEVSFINLKGKDPKRAKVTKDEAIRDQKVVNGPVYSPTHFESYDEVDAEEHVTRRVRRELGSGYYVSKPAQWTQPVPEGVAVGDLCEIHTVMYMKYTAGGKSYKKVLGRWMMQVDRYTAPILCANAKRISKLK